MPSTETPFDWADVEVAVPRSSNGLPGVSMAGFRHRVPGRVDIAMVAHPSVTLLIDLADEVGWSRKRLWSRFRSQLGITPKHAARLVRFDHAAHLLAAGHPAADVAPRSGYVDQSHLHREVKTFTGRTPTALASAPWLGIDDIAWR